MQDRRSSQRGACALFIGTLSVTLSPRLGSLNSLGSLARSARSLGSLGSLGPAILSYFRRSESERASPASPASERASPASEICRGKVWFICMLRLGEGEFHWKPLSWLA